MTSPRKNQKPKIKNKKHKLKNPKTFFSFWVCVFYFWFFIFNFSWSFASSPETFSFIVFGDNQGWDGVFKDAINKISQEKDIDFAISVGDMVPNGRENEYKHYLDLISNLKVKVYPTPGNHDMMKYGYKYYQKYFGPYYYSFDYENSHFVILNNAFRQSFHLEQFAWLKKDLAKTNKENIFVFMHKPTFDPTEIYKDHIMSGRETIKELMRVFKKYKVDYVFAGHIHGYAKAERDGVIYIVTGGAGAPLYLPQNFGGLYHYVKVNVKGENIKDEVVKLYE